MSADRRVYKHQNQIIYEWEQSLEEVNLFIRPPPGIIASQIQCDISSTHVTLGLRGCTDKFLNHNLTSSVIVAESYWMLDQGELCINLQKMKKGLMWSSVFVGHGEMDPLEQEETKKKLMLERFQEENPGFDFSGAEFNGSAPDPRTFMGAASMEPKPDAKGAVRKSSSIPTESVVRRSIQNIEDARKRSTSIAKGQIRRNASSIKFKTTFRNTIYDTMLRRGWKEAGTEASVWDFYWADREYVYELLDRAHLTPGQRVNHFRNGREDLLIKNLKRAKRLAEKRVKANDPSLYHQNTLDKQLGNYDFFPKTYILPSEYAMFVEEFKKHQGVWIMKPIGKAQGKGIFLITKLSQINDWRGDNRTQGTSPPVETYIVQRYVANPYLVGGKKFDMRLYALVTSFSPLEVYIYRGGFARFTNTRYSMNSTDISNTFIHLTNVAIQKTSENYNSQHGGKWDLHNLKCFMMAKHGVDRVDDLFFEIQCVIIKSLLSVEKIIINDKHCFELYGYDIMIDQELKPWLLEVNASPSLSANTASDYQLKCGMLYEMLDIIDVENMNKSAGSEELKGFDLVVRNGHMQRVEACRYKSYLGASFEHANHTQRRGHSNQNAL
ncbi:hypothetical protein ABG067_000612 [Albugo candida]